MLNPREYVLSTELRSLLLILQICGIFPIFKYDQLSKFCKINSFGLFYMRFVACFIASSAVYFGYFSWIDINHFNLMKTSYTTDNFNQFLESVFCVLTYSFIFFICIMKSGNQLAILNDFLHLDDKLRRFYSHNVTSVTRKYTLILYINVFWFLYVFVSGLILNSENAITYAIVLCYYWLLTLIYTPHVILIVSLLKLISERLKWLNKIIDDDRNDFKHLLSMLSLYERILRLMHEMNNTYGLTVLICLAYGFYTITNEFYVLFGILVLSLDYDWALLAEIMSSIVWISTYLILIFCLSFQCGNVYYEAKKTAEILSRAYGKGKDYQNIIDKFLTKSIRQETKFTAYGFFDIDTSTLFKIISAVTTYLVILIQFKQLEESKTT